MSVLLSLSHLFVYVLTKALAERASIILSLKYEPLLLNFTLGKKKKRKILFLCHASFRLFVGVSCRFTYYKTSFVVLRHVKSRMQYYGTTSERPYCHLSKLSLIGLAYL